jgi:hypothetical protein
VTQPQIYTFSWFVIYRKNINPHHVIKHLFSQEANKIQLEMINGHLEFEFLMSMTHHIVTR